MQNAQSLRKSIAHLAFPTAPTLVTSLRRSSRLSASTSLKNEPSTPPLHRSTKRKQVLESELEQESPSPSPSKKRRPTKRGYADPATYAHLKALDDHLAADLDVIFCGINPGHKSALTSHHFANPTNHFWRCLHRSGFTTRLLSPTEDSTLPSEYNIGLTNLVERPSIEQAELSKEEMKQSVPALKAKIVVHRPHIVCFVGKGIWLIIEAHFKCQISNMSDLSLNDDNKQGLSTSSATNNRRPRRGAKLEADVRRFDWGIQPYKLVYPLGHDADIIKFEDTEGSVNDNVAQDSLSSKEAMNTVHETLFFVMPSTSGRVVSHQLSDKVKLFTHLHAELQRKKSKRLDTSSMIPIPLT